MGFTKRYYFIWPPVNSLYLLRALACSYSRMLLKEIIPSPYLSGFIRLYRIIDFDFPDDTPIPPKAYPPRPEQCLQFFLTPAGISYPDSNTTTLPKHALLVGQHTVVNYRNVCKQFLSVQVVFQPGALYRLLGIPATAFNNKLIEAEDVLGKEITFINEQLYEAKSHTQMIGIIELFINSRIKKTRITEQGIDSATQQMLQQYDTCSLDYFVRNSYLSHRQFNRKFTERIGIGPKEFLRVIRFYDAYMLKNRFPDKDWLAIAVQCGYHDYQHLVKDYKTFTGHTPAKFFALDSPERVLGSEEVY
jgi:AraC-like DNA-binding protein